MIQNDDFNRLLTDFPAMNLKFKKHLMIYDDRDIKLRMHFVKNVPLMRTLS